MTFPTMPTPPGQQSGSPQIPAPAMPAQPAQIPIQQQQQQQQQPTTVYPAAAIPAQQPIQQPAQQPVQQQIPLNTAVGFPQATAVPAIAMAGGAMQMMEGLRKSIAEATLAKPRRGLPLGKAIYVLNNIVYEFTPTNNIPIFNVHVTCALPGVDANGLQMGEAGYSGAMPGTGYSFSIFKNGKFGINTKQFLEVVTCLSGMTEEQMKQYQGTQEGVTYLQQLISLYMGINFDTDQATQSCTANMHMVEINTIHNIVDKKVSGVKVLDAGTGQPMKTEYINNYFNRHVLLTEIWPLFQGQEEILYGYFGGQENFLRAWQAQNPTP